MQTGQPHWQQFLNPSVQTIFQSWLFNAAMKRLKHFMVRLFVKKILLLSKVIKILRVEYLLKPVFWTAKYLNDSTCKPAGLAFPNIPRFEYYLIHFRSNMHVSLDSGYHCTTKYVFFNKKWFSYKVVFLQVGGLITYLDLIPQYKKLKKITLQPLNITSIIKMFMLAVLILMGKSFTDFQFYHNWNFLFCNFFLVIQLCCILFCFYFCHVFSFVTDFGIQSHFGFWSFVIF